MPTLTTRTISGKGLLLIDAESDDYNKGKVFTLFVDVIRRPQNEYLNFAYNPARSRYATIVCMRGDYVVESHAIEFPQQRFIWAPELEYQQGYAIQCAYAGILQSFANLGTALGLTVIEVLNGIQGWNHSDLMFDTIKVVCYSNTAVRLTMKADPYDLCEDQSDKQPKPPPVPPPFPPHYPPDQGLQDTDDPVDPPYDGGDDNGDSVPFPGDVALPPPEFPQGNRCDRYSVTVTATKSTGGTDTDTSPFFGEISYVGIKPGDNTKVIVVSHNLILTGGTPCSPTEVETVVFGFSGGYVGGSATYTITPI